MAKAKKEPCRLMGLTGLQRWLADRGVVYSRKSLERWCLMGRFGQKIDGRWIITEQEAQELLETLPGKGP